MSEPSVAVRVNGRRFRHWTEVRVVRSIDAMDLFEMAAPFASDAPGFRDTFRPFSYQPVDVYVDNAALFTGTLVTVDPSLDGDGKTVQCGGYSLPGVLGDCTPKINDDEFLEFDGQNLREITNYLAAPFGITAQFDAPAGALFDRAATNPARNVLGFLVDLAQQRRLLVSSTTDGKLLFQRTAAVGTPVARLVQGQSPLVSVVPSFSPQQYYSQVTGVDAMALGSEGSQYTVKNPRLTGVTRPVSFTVNDAEGGEVKDAVQAKLARMFGSMASYSVSVSTWYDGNGNLWAPNSTIELTAPGAMIYKPYSFILRSVAFTRSSSGSSAQLDLVLPGAFTGEPPGALPWD